MGTVNKVIYVKAFFKPIGKNVTVKVPTGEKKKGLFGGETEVMREETQWVQTGFSESKVDAKRLSEDVAEAISVLNQEGYEVVTVLSVISGDYAWQFQAEGIRSSVRIFGDTEKVSGGASYGYGYGYSFTEGVSIIAKKTS